MRKWVLERQTVAFTLLKPLMSWVAVQSLPSKSMLPMLTMRDAGINRVCQGRVRLLQSELIPQHLPAHLEGWESCPSILLVVAVEAHLFSREPGWGTCLAAPSIGSCLSSPMRTRASNRLEHRRRA